MGICCANKLEHYNYVNFGVTQAAPGRAAFALIKRD